MFSTIVVGTDGSANSEEAVRVAAEMAATGDGKLHVVSAYHPLSAADVTSIRASLPQEFRGVVDADGAVRDRIRSAVRVGRHYDIEIVEHPVEGDATESVLDIADEVDADLIVVGSRGLRGLRRTLGSVSTRLVHHSNRSVLVVHPKP